MSSGCLPSFVSWSGWWCPALRMSVFTCLPSGWWCLDLWMAVCLQLFPFRLMSSSLLFTLHAFLHMFHSVHNTVGCCSSPVSLHVCLPSLRLSPSICLSIWLVVSCSPDVSPDLVQFMYCPLCGCLSLFVCLRVSARVAGGVRLCEHSFFSFLFFLSVCLRPKSCTSQPN